MIVGLALRTQIPYGTWLAEDPRAVLTAIRLIEEADRKEEAGR